MNIDRTMEIVLAHQRPFSKGVRSKFWAVFAPPGSAVMAGVKDEHKSEGEKQLGSNLLGGYVFVNFCPVPRDAFFHRMPVFRIRRRSGVHTCKGRRWNEKAKPLPPAIKAV